MCQSSRQTGQRLMAWANPASSQVIFVGWMPVEQLRSLPWQQNWWAGKSQPYFPTSAINQKSPITKQTQKVHVAVSKHLPVHLPCEVSISGMATFSFMCPHGSQDSVLGARHSLPAAAEMSSGTSFIKPSFSGSLEAGKTHHTAFPGMHPS